MIQRKMDEVGNVTGFFNTETNSWVPEEAHDETTNAAGTVLDEDTAQALVDKRAEEVAEAIEE